VDVWIDATGEIRTERDEGETKELFVLSCSGVPADQRVTVATFRNKSSADMSLHLEMLAEEVVMSPGHAVELLACPTDGLLPITIDWVEGGLQIHPHHEFDQTGT